MCSAYLEEGYFSHSRKVWHIAMSDYLIIYELSGCDTLT